MNIVRSIIFIYLFSRSWASSYRPMSRSRGSPYSLLRNNTHYVGKDPRMCCNCFVRLHQSYSPFYKVALLVPERHVLVLWGQEGCHAPKLYAIPVTGSGGSGTDVDAGGAAARPSPNLPPTLLDQPTFDLLCASYPSQARRRAAPARYAAALDGDGHYDDGHYDDDLESSPSHLGTKIIWKRIIFRREAHYYTYIVQPF